MKLQSKYNIDDVVWIMNDNLPRECRICEIRFSYKPREWAVSYGMKDLRHGHVYYRQEKGNDLIFDSLEALLGSL